MPSNATDHGLDLVLDHRKLILLFAGLMLLCGLFFVFGFVEGKRQAVRAVSPASAGPAAEPTARMAPVAAPVVEERAVKEQLEWYRNTKPPGEARAPEPATAGAAARTPAMTQPAPNASPPAPVARPSPRAPAGATYSVQVGAFRQKKEAELKAAALAARGYRYTLEPPSSEGGFYLLKVGRFESRADAIALDLRLRKDGFPTLLKRN